MGENEDPNVFKAFVNSNVDGNQYFFSLVLVWRKHCLNVYFNPLSPNINIQILLSDLNIFSYTISWENLLKDQSNFPSDNLILITFSLDEVLIL